MFIYIGGVPGVGKTTIIREIGEIAKRNRLPIQIMNEKEMLCKLANVRSVLEYCFLPEIVRSKARKRMVDHFRELDRKDQETIRIRDDHFSYLKQDGTYFLRPINAEDVTQILAFVVITAKPKTILERRSTDALSRPRHNLENYNLVNEHQQIELKTAFDQSEKLGVPIEVFRNKEGEIVQTSSLIFSFIKKLQT